jgi:hypothetical protein
MAGYLLNISWGELWVAKREKESPPCGLKRLPCCTLKRVGGLGDKVRKKHSGTFASDEPKKVLPFDEGLLKGRRFSFRLPIFNFLGWWWGKLKNLPLGN